MNSETKSYQNCPDSKSRGSTVRLRRDRDKKEFTIESEDFSDFLIYVPLLYFTFR